MKKTIIRVFFIMTAIFISYTFLFSDDSVAFDTEKKDDLVVLQRIPELEKTTIEQDTELLYPAFFVMAKRGDISTLKLFISKRLDVNKKNSDGMTVILEAVKANQEKTIEFLLKKGADPKIVTKNGVNALRFSVENNNKRLVKLFLNKGIKVVEKDIFGKTPLMVSIEKNYTKITKILLGSLEKFDIDMQDKNGKSLLMAAVENNDVDLVKTLLSKNVNVWLLNNKNEDALSIAEKHNNEQLIKLLKKQMDKDRKKDPKLEQWIRKPGDKTNIDVK